MNWYKHSIDEVIEYLGTSMEKGLTDNEVIKRLEIYSTNELKVNYIR